MAYVVADPEMMTAAAADLTTVGSDLSIAHLAAAARTTSVIPAAADEVSTAIASLMSTHGLDFQAVAQSASAFHQEFTHKINAAAAAYSSTETAAAAAVTPRLISLPEFFQLALTDFGTATGNFASSFGSFPNLAYDQLGRAGSDALAILLWPITYPVTAVTIFAVEAVFAALLNGA